MGAATRRRASAADIAALHAAIAELRTAALDANMSAVDRAAELAQLAASLKTANSVTDRVAIRA